MNYEESRAYIEDAQKYGSVLGLSNMREMMNRLGNPQDRLSYVHVAGTNGKGGKIYFTHVVFLSGADGDSRSPGEPGKICRISDTGCQGY